MILEPGNYLGTWECSWNVENYLGTWEMIEEFVNDLGTWEMILEPRKLFRNMGNDLGT